MLKNHNANRRISGSTLVYFVIGLVILVISYLVIDSYILKEEPEVISEKAIQPAVEVTENTNETVAEETKAVLHNSVAVLPFENLSPPILMMPTLP